jgi:hypothetical protein
VQQQQHQHQQKHQQRRRQKINLRRTCLATGGAGIRVGISEDMQSKETEAAAGRERYDGSAAEAREMEPAVNEGVATPVQVFDSCINKTHYEEFEKTENIYVLNSRHQCTCHHGSPIRTCPAVLFIYRRR